MKRFLLTLLVCAVLATPAMAVLTTSYSTSWNRGNPGSTWQEWTFNDNDNPALPDDGYNPYGDPCATLTGDNLQYYNVVGSRTGIWHAGSSLNDLLTIDLVIPNNEKLNAYKEIWLEAIYAVKVESAYAWAVFENTDPSYVEVQQIGDPVVTDLGDTWYSIVYHWKLIPNPYEETICLFISGTGGSIDSIVVDTICSIPAPGAILLGSIGVGLVGWLRRRRTL